MNNFNEQKQKILAGGYKYIQLVKGANELTKRNKLHEIEKQFDIIKAKLDNNPTGRYTISAQHRLKDQPELFEVITGPENLAEPAPRVIIKEPASDKLLENQQILNLTVQVKQLEMENQYLREQIADLESEIAELESAAAQTLAEATPAPSLLESAKEFLGGLMEFGAPLLDQHFALQKQKLEIEQMKLAGRRPAPGSKQAVKDQNVQIRIIGEFVETFKDQPETYEALHSISAQSESVPQFMELLNQFSPDLYEQLSIKI